LAEWRRKDSITIMKEDIEKYKYHEIIMTTMQIII